MILLNKNRFVEHTTKQKIPRIIMIRGDQFIFQILNAGELVLVMESDIIRLRYSFGVIPVCFLN